MLSSADKLMKAGAEFLISPDNTIHQAFQIVEEEFPLPTLDSTIILTKAALNFALK